MEYNLERSHKELKRWVSGDLAGVKLTAESDGAKLEERIERIEKELQIKLTEQKNFMELISNFSGLNNLGYFFRFLLTGNPFVHYCVLYTY